MSSIRYGLDSNNNPYSFGVNNNLSTGIKAVRVIDIILNEKSIPVIFKYFGEYSTIGNIIFELPEFPQQTTPQIDINNVKIAKPIFSNIKHYPLKNEIVYIIELPSTDINNNPEDIDYYYFPPINLWASNHHNALPNEAFTQLLPDSQKRDYQQVEGGSIRKATDGNTEIDLGKTFKEKLNIQPLQPYEGDIIYEGRWGQSIRFSSTINPSDNNWSNNSSNGEPITIINNGIYNNGKQPWFPTVEDINLSPSSIWLSSTQQLPLEASSINYKSYTPKNAPEDIKQYNKGSQQIFNADRIVINAKKDHILLSARKSVGLNSENSVNIDAKVETIINSPSIILGKGDRIKSEPILLGDKTFDVINTILEEVINLSNSLSTLVSLPADVPFLDVNIIAENTKTRLLETRNNLQNIKSKISKTE